MGEPERAGVAPETRAPRWWKWILAPVDAFRQLQLTRWEQENRARQERLQAALEREKATRNRLTQEWADEVLDHCETRFGRFYPGCARHRVATDKEGWPVFLYTVWDHKDLEVKAFCPYSLHHDFVLFATIQGATAEIDDIQCNRDMVNRGVGTAVLQFAEEILRELGVTRVWGWLSPCDADHRDRQIHFYQTNGYKVRARDDMGTISKDLQVIVGSGSDASAPE